MNLVTSLIARIEEYRKTNAVPCKNYATEQAAEKATASAAYQAAQYLVGKDADPARYLVIYNPAWGRWVGALDFTELLSRPGAGGYVGCARGFFTF